VNAPVSSNTVATTPRGVSHLEAASRRVSRVAPRHHSANARTVQKLDQIQIDQKIIYMIDRDHLK
jgi:hypothetical protein